MTSRRWFLVGIVVLVLAQTLVWLFAGSVWWTFRGGIVWPGQEPDPTRIARDSFVAIAFYIAAAINVAVLLAFLARPGRRFTLLLAVIQTIDALAAVAFTLVIDKAWILITALAVPTLALLYLAERRRSTATLQPIQPS
jgi:hypothetical protein